MKVPCPNCGSVDWDDGTPDQLKCIAPVKLFHCEHCPVILGLRLDTNQTFLVRKMRSGMCCQEFSPNVGVLNLKRDRLRLPDDESGYKQMKPVDQLVAFNNFCHENRRAVKRLIRP